ncbi:hypothetical protein F2P81_017886 [Scophthalmus maximus]|uniref:Uncharacterized protein n=1 Tax=Scophthalmus maximus TaxID=52904 RepID=A0A6A4SCG3_SCOMX|nr:hypothetical protein F2P81_017886 [Scophthalmus maximus]
MHIGANERGRETEREKSQPLFIPMVLFRSSLVFRCRGTLIFNIFNERISIMFIQHTSALRPFSHSPRSGSDMTLISELWTRRHSTHVQLGIAPHGRASSWALGLLPPCPPPERTSRDRGARTQR